MYIMVCNIKSSAEEQYKAERKRFLNRMKPKPVLAEKIEKRLIREQKEQEKARKYFEEL
jgi:hypothetical protein